MVMPILYVVTLEATLKTVLMYRSVYVRIGGVHACERTRRLRHCFCESIAMVGEVAAAAAAAAAMKSRHMLTRIVSLLIMDT